LGHGVTFPFFTMGQSQSHTAVTDTLCHVADFLCWDEYLTMTNTSKYFRDLREQPIHQDYFLSRFILDACSRDSQLNPFPVYTRILQGAATQSLSTDTVDVRREKQQQQQMIQVLFSRVYFMEFEHYCLDEYSRMKEALERVPHIKQLWLPLEDLFQRLREHLSHQLSLQTLGTLEVLTVPSTCGQKTVRPFRGIVEAFQQQKHQIMWYYCLMQQDPKVPHRNIFPRSVAEARHMRDFFMGAQLYPGWFVEWRAWQAQSPKKVKKPMYVIVSCGYDTRSVLTLEKPSAAKFALYQAERQARSVCETETGLRVPFQQLNLNQPYHKTRSRRAVAQAKPFVDQAQRTVAQAQLTTAEVNNSCKRRKLTAY